MGYSVSVKFKNEDQRQKMKNFLIENKEILDKMQKVEFSRLPYSNIPKDGEHLGYAPKKNFLLGFHGTNVPHYIWAVCSWMSLKADAKKGDDYYFYYDDEKMIVTTDLKNLSNTIVDENGVIIVEEPQTLSEKFKEMILGEHKSKVKQQEMLTVLDQKWAEYVAKDEPQNKTTVAKKMNNS